MKLQIQPWLSQPTGVQKCPREEASAPDSSNPRTGILRDLENADSPSHLRVHTSEFWLEPSRN